MRISPDELKSVFQNFRWIDDIPEDQNTRDEICVKAKAALLLEANITSEMMPAFLRLDGGKSGCRLPEPVSFTLSDGYGKKTNVSLQFFGFGEENDFQKHWGPQLLPAAPGNLFRSFNYSVQNESFDYTRPLTPGSDDIKKFFYGKYPSFYSICKDITPYKEPSRICRFWGCSAEPFAKIKVRTMRPDYIWGNVPLSRTPEMEGWSDARIEQNAIRYLIPCQSPLLANIRLDSRYYENWYSQIFPFRNEYGEEIMKLIKVYDPETQYKHLIPVTIWIRNHSPVSQIFCLPYPEDKTPLYNLDLLLKPECRTVILCDSVELADANQRENGSGEVVFTSFICSPGKYEQVDWSPLQEKDLVMLVSNHSGVMLESAALKAKELKEYLCEEQELTPSIAVVPVEYNNRIRRGFDSVEDILKRFAEEPPHADPDDLTIFETESEIEVFFRKAEAKLNELPRKWYEKQSVASEEKRIIEERKTRLAPIDFVLNPLLVRKEATMLYAQKGVGKSALAYSIAARVAAAGLSARPIPLLPEKWWTVPKGRYKVLYLDFENMGEMEKKKKAFQEGYFPAGKEQECRNNLLMRDLSQSSMDFSAPENHQKLFDLLEDAKKEGIPNTPVDLLVIDTYTAFVRTETPATPAHFKELINKIRKMNIAVLIVHHANSENEARGLSSKLDALFLTVNLKCDVEGDLNEQPRTVTYEHPRAPMCSKIRAPFKILFDRDSRRWCVENPERDENAELALIAEEYRKCKYDRDAICEMLGLEKSALSARLKKAKEIK